MITSLIWDFFFQIAISFSHMLRLFRDSFIFGEATSSHFFRVTASTQQLLSRSSYFFRTAAFLRIFFFRTVTFSLLFFQNSIFFREKLLQSSQFLRIGSYLGHLLFGTAIFLAEELFRIKISTEELLFQSRYFCTAPTLSGKLHFGKSLYFRKAILRITYFFWRAALLEWPLFQKTLPSIAFIF